MDSGTKQGEALLRVRLDAEDVCVVSHAEVPVEKLPVIALRRTGQVLHFVDTRGGATSFDLSSIYEDGDRFVHLSLRVGPSFAAQADALLTRDGRNARDVFAKGGRAVRLQPFYLPECSGDPSELKGRGLFFRGLHYAGQVTPSNVSLLCLCDACHRTFRLQSFHAGFNNLTYLYCSRQPHTLTGSSYLDDAPPVLGKAVAEAVARFESSLPSCTACGGSFRYLNPLRCPHCCAPYIDFEKHPGDREGEYYGNLLCRHPAQQWEPG